MATPSLHMEGGMLVKVNTSLAGADFSYNFGAVVDSEEFAAKVGSGWENLCDEMDAEEAPEPAADVAPVEEPIEVAVKPAPVEVAVKRGRRR